MKTLMKPAITFILVFFLFSFELHAAENLPDQIKAAIQPPSPKSGVLIEALIVKYVTMDDIEKITANKEILIAAILKSKLPQKVAIQCEIEAVYAKRFMKLEKAKSYLVKGLNSASPKDLLYIRLFQLLAFVETDLENHMGAMESYMMVDKSLKRINDTSGLVKNYNNIADLYIKSNLYDEAIVCLNKAYTLVQQQGKMQVPRLLYENKAIAYFHLKQLDSLQFYVNKTIQRKNGSIEDSLTIHLMKYMVLMLKKDPSAIREMKTLIDNPKNWDKLYTYVHLADAYILFNQTKKAKEIILKLLASDDLKNLGYMRSRLLHLMGDAYQKENKFDLSSQYYKKAILQSSLNTEKMMKTGSILSLLKYDEIKDKYARAEENLKVRQNYLILSITGAAMIILTLIFFYRSLKIKKKYDELMFSKLNTELSFINSHEVRRYLSNILGIVSVIKISDDKSQTYFEFEDALHESAENLDISIKSIAAKLNTKSFNQPDV